MDNPEKLVTQVSLDCLFLFFLVLCTQCYKFLWIVHSCLSSSCVPNVTSFSGFSILVCLFLVYPMLQVSLDFPFLFFLVVCTQCYKFLWIVYSCFSSSCVPNVASFSGLFILVCLRLVYPMLLVSLDCPFLFVFVLCTQCYNFLWIVHSCFSSSCAPNVTNFSGLSILVFLRLVYPLLQVSLECPFVTLGTQDEEKQEWTIQRNL
jgi:hypothetical protein